MLYKLDAVEHAGLDWHAETGSTVHEAAIPGRCAAPPAAAMMTLKPFSFASLRITHPVRRAVAEVMRAW